MSTHQRKIAFCMAISTIFITLGTAYAAPFAYISNAFSGDISVIDTATNSVVTTIPVGIGPHGVVVNPQGTRVYVAHAIDSVSVIDTSTNVVITTIPVGGSPYGIAINPSGKRVYVANYSGDTVSVIDTSTNAVISTIPVKDGPEGVAVNRAGTRLYVTHSNNGIVAVIDTNSNAVIATVPVGELLEGLAVNPSGTHVFVANYRGDELTVIDTSTNGVVAHIPVGDGPFGVAVNPEGTRVYVSNFNSNTVSVVDASTNVVIGTIPVENGPEGISVNPTGTRVYVANMNSNKVSVIDTSTNTVITTIPVGNHPVAFGQFISPAVIWSGPVSIPIKYTSLVRDPAGDSKFSKASGTSTGTIEFYEVGLIPVRVKFLVPESWVLLDILSIACLATEVSRSKTDQFVLIGTGDSHIGDGTILTGTAYLDAKGTLKKDGSGNVTSIILNGKISGGYSSEVIFNGTVKATLTK